MSRGQLTQENTLLEMTDTARATQIKIDMPKAEVDAAFNAYWAQVKDVLPAELVKKASKGGYRTVKMDQVVKVAGGKSKFFAPVLTELAIERVAKSSDRHVLYVVAVNLVEGVMTDTVEATVYLEPAVTWKAELPGNPKFKVKVPKQPDNFVERAVEQEIEELRDSKSVFVPVDRPSREGDLVVVSIDSKFEDGTMWPEGCGQNLRWPLKRNWHKVEALHTALTGTTAPANVSVDFVMPEGVSEHTGKRIHVDVSLTQVLEAQRAPVDDDLAISAGFKNLTGMMAALKTRAITSNEYLRREILWQSVLGQLLNKDVVSLDTIPFLWARDKARKIWDSARATVKTEEDLVDQVAEGVPDLVIKTKEDVITYLAKESAILLTADMVVRSWGIQRGIGDTESRSLERLQEYVELVKSEILANHVDVEDGPVSIDGNEVQHADV
jgi:FKBP-type peptidyl-prolyl cis-trans isomerase (trigger factor)